MRHEPRLPDASVNVSLTHPLAEASTLLVGLALIAAVVSALIFFSVEILVRAVSVERETAWFEDWAPRDERAPQSERERAAADLLQRLAARWPDAPYAFRLSVMDDDMVNAFALPGGLIVVTTGLLDSVDSENALAFVLGHELGHFAGRDHLRQLGRAAAFGLIVSAIGTSSADASLTVGVADLTLRGFGREQERDADVFGLALVHREYGHVADAWSFFENDALPSTGSWDDYLGTHPNPATRIDALADLARANGWPARGQVAPWPPQ